MISHSFENDHGQLQLSKINRPTIKQHHFVMLLNFSLQQDMDEKADLICEKVKPVISNPLIKGIFKKRKSDRPAGWIECCGLEVRLSRLKPYMNIHLS